ncbi:MAG: hypothetical protein WDN26_08300 [Chitinophagaceae bacterium]
MDQAAILISLATDWQFHITDQQRLSVQLLEERINHLLTNDFDKLISLLYRMDVSEKKLRTELQQHPQEDAARIITALVMEREWQKIQSRKQFSGKEEDEIPDEEKW